MSRRPEIASGLPDGLIDMNLMSIIVGYDDWDALRVERMVLKSHLHIQAYLYRAEMTNYLIQVFQFMQGRRRDQGKSLEAMLNNLLYEARSQEGCQRYWCRIGREGCCCGDPVLANEAPSIFCYGNSGFFIATAGC